MFLWWVGFAGRKCQKVRFPISRLKQIHGSRFLRWRAEATADNKMCDIRNSHFYGIKSMTTLLIVLSHYTIFIDRTEDCPKRTIWSLVYLMDSHCKQWLAEVRSEVINRFAVKKRMSAHRHELHLYVITYMYHFTNLFYGCTFSLSKQFCLPSEKGSTLNGKKVPLLEAHSFSFMIATFSEWGWWSGKQTGRQASCLPCRNGGKCTMLSRPLA